MMFSDVLWNLVAMVILVIQWCHVIQCNKSTVKSRWSSAPWGPSQLLANDFGAAAKIPKSFQIYSHGGRLHKNKNTKNGNVFVCVCSRMFKPIFCVCVRVLVCFVILCGIVRVVLFFNDYFRSHCIMAPGCRTSLSMEHQRQLLELANSQHAEAWPILAPKRALRVADMRKKMCERKWENIIKDNVKIC